MTSLHGKRFAEPPRLFISAVIKLGCCSVESCSITDIRVAFDDLWWLPPLVKREPLQARLLPRWLKKRNSLWSILRSFIKRSCYSFRIKWHWGFPLDFLKQIKWYEPFFFVNKDFMLEISEKTTCECEVPLERAWTAIIVVFMISFGGNRAWAETQLDWSYFDFTTNLLFSAA